MLFIGDSITDCGRRERAIPLGDGYVSMFAELATARYPERNIEWTNMGIGGNRTTHLKERWQSDVIEHRPDRLSIKIGINDLSSFRRGDPDGVPPDLFKRNYDQIMTSTRQALGEIPVLLITPFYISTNMDDDVEGAMLRTIPEYIKHRRRDERQVRHAAAQSPQRVPGTPAVSAAQHVLSRAGPPESHWTSGYR